MPKPLRLAAFLLVALAVVASGCGSTNTVSTTTTTSPNASASTPAIESTQTASTSSTGAHTTTAPAPKAAEVKPQRQEKAGETKHEHEQKSTGQSSQASKPPVNAVVLLVPRSRQYPKQMQHTFIVTCTSLKGTTSSCECLLAKFELSNVEKGQSLAELLATEFTLLHERGTPLPAKIQRLIQACHLTLA
jgi:uncharacterized protein YceK